MIETKNLEKHFEKINGVKMDDHIQPDDVVVVPESFF